MTPEIQTLLYINCYLLRAVRKLASCTGSDSCTQEASAPCAHMLTISCSHAQAEAGTPQTSSSASLAAQPTASAAPVAAAPVAVAQVASSSEPLPEGWSEAVDPSYNHPYWYNVNTSERTWVRPMPAAKAAAPAAASGMAKASPPPKMTGTPLPLGWSEAVAPDTGLPYYFNAATGVCLCAPALLQTN